MEAEKKAELVPMAQSSGPAPEACKTADQDNWHDHSQLDIRARKRQKREPGHELEVRFQDVLTKNPKADAHDLLFQSILSSRPCNYPLAICSLRNTSQIWEVPCTPYIR